MIKDNAGKIYRPATPKIIVDSNGKIYHGNGQFLPETEAIFAKAKLENFTIPELSIKTRINIIIFGLRSNGIWDKLSCFYWGALASGSSYTNFRRINWKNPFGNLATNYGGITLTNYGWLGNALNGYVDTGFNPVLHGGSIYTQNNACVGAVVYQATALAGQYSNIWGNNSSTIYANNGVAYQYINSAIQPSGGRSFSGTGLKLLNRFDAASNISYPQNSAVTQASQALVSENINILRAATTGYSDVGVTCFFMGKALETKEYNVIQALCNTALGSLGLNKIA